MPAGGNENQQACERGLVCAPDTKRFRSGGAGAKSCASAQVRIPAGTLRVTHGGHPQRQAP